MFGVLFKINNKYFVCSIFLEKMLEALRQCEPDMPTLSGPNATVDFFSQSTVPVINQPTMIDGTLQVEDGIISSTSSLTSTKASTMVVHTLAEIYDRELVSTIGWAKQIPGVYKSINILTMVQTLVFGIEPTFSTIYQPKINPINIFLTNLIMNTF